MIPFPDGLARFGRTCFAIALVAFGAASFVVGDFVAGRAPAWPAGAPGRVVWAYFTGALLIVAGVRILLGRRPVFGALTAAVVIFGWAFLRQLPVAFADHQLGGAWTGLGKALTLSGGAVGVAASIIWSSASLSTEELRRAPAMNLIGRCSLGAFLILAGIQHFLFTAFVVTLVPTWIPGPLFWTYFAAVALIAGGVGLILPVTSRLAAALVGAMIFIWVLVLHIPRGVTMHNQNEWTAVVEALAFSGIAFALVARQSSRE